MKQVFIFSMLLCFCGNSTKAQTGIPIPTMTTCDNLVNNFLATYNIPSATFALAKDGKLVYMRGFGNANIAGTEPTQPYHLFRIASLSKPITAIAIMKLVEDGQISLSSKVFGAGGILAAHPIVSTATISDSRIYDITVQHLLEHSAGWNRDVNCFPSPTPPYLYYFGGCDPIAVPLHVASTLGTTNPVSESHLIKFLLQKGLNFTPGTSYAYSNIAYLVLGEIIATKTGQTYENYVKNTILSPLGICDMHIGRNLLANKQEREGEYVGNGYTTLSSYNTGVSVPWEYGGFNLEAMDAHGGWIATARDLVRLLVAIDGFSTKTDILSPSTIATMTTPSVNNNYYAKGWAVNSADNWWHTGALDGTASFLARTSGGYTWAIILNKRVIDANQNNFWSALDALPWNCIANTTTWPTHDLMLFPSQGSNNVTVTNLTATTATLSWANGNGEKRMVVLKEGSAIDKFPLDGSNYTANPTFGLGGTLTNSNYLVYNGTSNTVNITGLKMNTTYHVKIFDYNQNSSTGNQSLYKLCNCGTTSFMSSALPVQLTSFTGKLVDKQAHLNWTTANEEHLKGYEIEKSSDGSHFKKIDFVPSLGKGHAYRFVDEKPFLGHNYYRLKALDTDNSAQYSAIVSVSLLNKTDFNLLPNPTQGLLQVAGLDPSIVYTGFVLNALGVVVKEFKMGNQELLDLRSLPNGIYAVSIRTQAGTVTKKIVKQ